MKRFAFVPIVALVLGALAVPAAARHQGPPRVVLTSEETRQRARLLTHCWAYKQGDNGVGYCADSTYDWPDPDSAISGAIAKLRFNSKRCPNRLRVRYWTAVDADEQPVGDPTRLDATTRRKWRDDRPIACIAKFRLPEVSGDVYIETFAKWTKAMHYEHGTASSGDAQYSSHLQLTQ